MFSVVWREKFLAKMTFYPFPFYEFKVIIQAGLVEEVLFNLKVQYFLADVMSLSSELPAATVHVQCVSKQVVLSTVLAVVCFFKLLLSS